MTFENYARDWLDRQTFSKSIRKTTRQSLDYICKAIGELEIEDISESDIDEIFYNEQLFRRQIDFMERTFRVLNTIFDEIRERGLLESDPVLHIYCPVVLSHEKLILSSLDVELNSKSPFVDVSCMWLKKQGYKPVTYNLYYHFLNAFIHPFIGKKPIGLVDQNNISRIYTYFNTVNTNETWIGQIHLVMRMVFQYAIDNSLIQNNPMMKINDPHLEPILELTYMTVSARCGENLDEIQSEVGHGYSSDVITEYLHQTEGSIHESALRRQEYLEKIMKALGTDNG